MDHQRFREMGYEIIDWIADYMAHGYEGRVSPDTTPGELLARLPRLPPDQAEPDQALFADFREKILPGVTHWNDPRFFAYFPANHSGPAILGDLLSAGLGVNAMSWATSPAATELEIRMMDWLGHMIGLPWPGCIQDTASTATLCAVLSAREQKNPVNQKGFYASKPLIAYTSQSANSSVVKAVRISGIGDEYLRLVPVRDDFSMDPKALDAMVKRDRADGFLPCVVISTIGTTSSTAVDPIPAIASICRKYGIWQHIDAALAGSAAILPEMRWLMDGVADADSFVFNPHKWMFTNFACSAYFCKRPQHLKKALAIEAEYLKTAQDGVAENFRDWGIQLGRRFRALKLWFVIRAYGVEGLREKIRLHLRMAQWFAEKVGTHKSCRLLNEPRLNTVCFRLGDDRRTEALLKRVNATGRAFLTHTRLDGQYSIRVSFGQTHSRFEHAEKLWELMSEHIGD